MLCRRLVRMGPSTAFQQCTHGYLGTYHAGGKRLADARFGSRRLVQTAPQIPMSPQSTIPGTNA